MSQTDINSSDLRPGSQITEGNLTSITISSPPKPLSSTKDVQLIFGKVRGLQKIIWNSEPILDDVYGIEGKDKFNKLKDNLIKKYGNPSDGTEIVGLELYDEADEFYQCLDYAGCGSWNSIWEVDNGVSILLQLHGASRGEGWLSLAFEGPGWLEALGRYEDAKSESDFDAL
jgi:hypothetical protein